MNAIEQLSPHAFRLVRGANAMTLSFQKKSQRWAMLTDNPSARAWSGMAAMREFDSLAEVERHYKSWRGITALASATVPTQHNG